MTNNDLTREDILQAENELFAAQRSSDVDALSRLLYDDLLALAPNGTTATKDMDLAAYRQGAIVIDEASTTLEEVRLLGDTAVSVVVMQAKGSVMGTPLEGTFRYLRVWKRFTDGIKIVAASYMQTS